MISVGKKRKGVGKNAHRSYIGNPLVAAKKFRSVVGKMGSKKFMQKQDVIFVGWDFLCEKNMRNG